jgi:mono/diheme cytochrome c family protein
MRSVWVWFAAAALATAAIGASARAQTTIPREQPLVIKSTAGAELYRFYCSNCHGLDGRGRAAATEGGPSGPDLTRLAQPTGVFPRERVEAVIAHGSTRLASHGLTDMPVWGAIFRALDPSDARVKIRVDNLLDYLASIQEPCVGHGSR